MPETRCTAINVHTKKTVVSKMHTTANDISGEYEPFVRKLQLLTISAIFINKNKNYWPFMAGFQKTQVFFTTQPSGVFWVLLGFLDKQEKIGKIIQKLSNLKP